MRKVRLDRVIVRLGLVNNLDQAEDSIRLGKVRINNQITTNVNYLLRTDDIKNVRVDSNQDYVSRGGYKLASVAAKLDLNFKDRIILDIGSSTGGFTDYALQNGALKVIAVDAGTQQMDLSLRRNPKIELHEKTDIRDFKIEKNISFILIDVSFISIRKILYYLTGSINKNTEIVAMVKPQFETNDNNIKHKGIIKNERIRRDILKDFENWVKEYYVILEKADSLVSGTRGNTERFYLLKLSK